MENLIYKLLKLTMYKKFDNLFWEYEYKMWFLPTVFMCIIGVILASFKVFCTLEDVWDAFVYITIFLQGFMLFAVLLLAGNSLTQWVHKKEEEEK